MTDSLAPVVLVHGAWHGPWCWDRVTPLLDARDIQWQALDLPSMCDGVGHVTDLHCDAAILRDALDALDRPAVVVGHSYGGMVITEGASDHPNARHLVYLTAFMPDVGESLNAWIARFPPDPELLAGLVLDAERRSTIARAVVGPGFYNDCDEGTVAWAADRLRPMLSESNEPVRAAAWRGIPSTYAVCTQDRILVPDLQREMAQRASRVVEWDTSHSPFASRPELVADLIAEVARN